MLVKITVSAAGDRFALNYGQEIEWADLKKLIGNGAENFCVPVNEAVAWPPVNLPLEAPALETAIEPVEIERAVVEPVVEIADKFAPKHRGRNR